MVLNVNPRSMYNKVEEFKTLIEQLDCQLCFISESWDRSGLSIESLIQIENYRFVKNVCQRNGRGGKPALLVSEKEYVVKELCPNLITVPVGIEAV